MTSLTRRRPLGATLLLAGVVALAVAVAPGTIASFADQAEIPAGAIATGSAQLTVSTVASQVPTSVYPGGPAATLYPSASPVVRNTGTVPLAVSVTPTVAAGDPTAPGSVSFASAVTLSVALQTGSSCAAAPGPDARSVTSGMSTGTITALAPGEARTICAWQQLPISAPNGTYGQSATVTLALTGAQQ